MSDVEFSSSHWNKPVKNGLTYITEVRETQIWQEEYFNASFTFTNNGKLAENTNLSIQFNYSDQKIDREVVLGNLEPGSHTDITVPFLPNPTEKVLDWSQTNAVFTIQTEGVTKPTATELKVPIIVDTENFKSQVPEPTSHQESNNNDDISTLGDIDMPAFYVKDAYEGSSGGQSDIEKGKGPKGVVVIHFYEDVTGLYVTYSMKSNTHGWTATHTQYWSGTFYGGNTYILHKQFSWHIDSAKYVFGQGDIYNFNKVKVESGSDSDTYHSGSDAYFNIKSTNTENENRVFMLGIYDSWIADNHHCLSRSPSQYFSDGTQEFNYHDKFDIDYFIVLKQYNWLNWVDTRYVYVCGEWSYQFRIDHSTDHIKNKLWDAPKNVIGLDQDWTRNENTTTSNHGYDILNGISGLTRKSSIFSNDQSSNLGRAAGNWAWGTAGSGSFEVPDNWFDNLLQHELSHVYGAEHDDSGDNIMTSTLNGDHNNWFEPAANTIKKYQAKFSHTPVQ